MFDLILANGTVVDGLKTTRFVADVGIRGDRIERIGNLSDAPAVRRIDVVGKIVAPGFIDVHTHSEGWLLRTPHLLPKTTQGFTTEVLMPDGISYAPVSAETAREWLFYLRALDGLRLDEYRGWRTIDDFMQRLDGRNVQNTVAQVPYANVRSLACGFGRQAVDDFQMRQIKAEIRRAMADGAVGLSTGLDYIVQHFSTTDEIVEAASAIAEFGGLYVTHVRYKLGLLPALREAVAIGRRAGVKVHISHLKAQTPQLVEEVLTYIDTVVRHEVDLSFDVYPYQPGSTMLSYLLPYEVWEDGPLAALGKLHDPAIRARFRSGLELHRVPLDRIHIAWVAGKENSRHQGQTLGDYVREMDQPPEESLTNLLIEERLAVLCVMNEGEDPLVHPFLKHDLYMLGSDGIYHPESVIHPRMYGSAGRLLGPCVRDWRLFSLEEAVYKLSGYPAQRFGLAQRGVIRAGYFADIAVFDAATLTDHATFSQPHQPTTGIEHLLVNGVPILQSGQPVNTERLPGRYLKYKPA